MYKMFNQRCPTIVTSNNNCHSCHVSICQSAGVLIQQYGRRFGVSWSAIRSVGSCCTAWCRRSFNDIPLPRASSKHACKFGHRVWGGSVWKDLSPYLSSVNGIVNAWEWDICQAKRHIFRSGFNFDHYLDINHEINSSNIFISLNLTIYIDDTFEGIYHSLIHSYPCAELKIIGIIIVTRCTLCS